MRIFSLLLAAVALPFLTTSARADENADILAGAKAVYEAINARDVAGTVALTHPAIYKLTKGKEAYEKLTKASMDQLTQAGVTFEDIEVGIPTAPVKAGEDLISFIPTVYVMKRGPQKVKVTGFLVAIKSPEQSKWLYIDGTGGISDHPEMAALLLPGLPKDTKFPPVSINPM